MKALLEYFWSCTVPQVEVTNFVTSEAISAVVDTARQPAVKLTELAKRTSDLTALNRELLEQFCPDSNKNIVVG